MSPVMAPGTRASSAPPAVSKMPPSSQAGPFGGRRVEMIVFDGETASPALVEAVAQANVLLVSISPDDGVDPTLAHLRDAIAAAPALSAIVYLSTIAVYGNHDGGWIDEDTPLTPALTRAQDRIEAERAWQALGAARGVPVAVIRIAGIYGPGQNALETVKSGPRPAHRQAGPGVQPHPRLRSRRHHRRRDKPRLDPRGRRRLQCGGRRADRAGRSDRVRRRPARRRAAAGDLRSRRRRRRCRRSR